MSNAPRHGSERPASERGDRPKERAGAPREKTRGDEAARATADDECIDEEGRESFPASDPPSHTGITGEGRRGG